LADSVLTCEIENSGTLDTWVRMVSFRGFLSKELRPPGGERAGARDRALRQRRLEQLPRDDRPRARAEAGARPGARPDLPQPLDRRRMAGTAPERTPEEVMAERERAAVRVAVPEVDVGPLQVVRTERDPLQDRRLEVGTMSRQARLDPVRVVLTPRIRPLAAAEIRPTAGVALDPPRQFLELDPEEAAPVRRAGGIERERLADDDRPLVRQQPALCLVHGPRDPVEAGRDVDDRRPREALVTVPARRLRARVVDLHLRAAVA